MASSGGKQNQQLAVTWPAVFDKMADKPNTRWIIMKVDYSLDWRNELDGARMTLAKQASLRAPDRDIGLHARAFQDGWHSHLLLRPQQRSGSNKLGVTGSADVIVNITSAASEFDEVEKAARAAQAEFAEAARRRAKVEAPSRQYFEKRKAETQKLCAMKSLDSCLQAMGWEHGMPQEQEHEEEPEVPAGALPAEVLETYPEPLHLKPLKADEGEASLSLPVAFWSLCPFTASEMSKVNFDCWAVGSKGRALVGHFVDADAGKVKLTGAKVRRAKSSLAQRYLVGAQTAGSKKVFIQEAELYRVDVTTRIPKRLRAEGEEEEEEEGEALTRGEQRGIAVNTYGTVKKRRIRDQALAKYSTEHKVADFAKINEELVKKAQELEASSTSLTQKMEETRRKFLPTYDERAEKPRKVYKKGLDQIAPLEAMQGEPSFVGEANEELQALLMRKPAEVMASKTLKNLPAICRNCISTAVIASWARHQHELGADKLEQPAAEKLAMKIICLHHLIKAYQGGRQLRNGKCSAQLFANLAELPFDQARSAIIKHWHKHYCDESLGNSKKIRNFNGKKLLFAIIIWALHLTPGLSFELSGDAAEEELGTKIENLQKRFEYVGCEVAKHLQPVKLAVRLAGPPKSNLAHYQAQTRKGDEKSSKRGR